MREDDDSDIHHSFKNYPHRRSGKSVETFWDNLRTTPRQEYQKKLCERKVAEAFKNDPVIKILKGALKKAGCPINLRRHVICEDCDTSVQGGYDAEYNQIVICKNVYKARNYPNAILIHELIHMYDSCVNEFNPKNLEHLACTEIRAANIAHCSFLSSVLLRESSPLHIKKTHQYCVQRKAAQSLMVARNVDAKTASKYILKVFEKCYNDLEPIGRRFKRKSLDPVLAEEEAKCFLICDP